jgi:AhpD family alkylhydroperoxidase
MDTTKISQGYEEMIGRVPPKVAKRLALSAEIDPDALARLEDLRADFLESRHIDPKAVQLIAFAILLTQTSDAAKFHGLAAMRAGASREELHDAAKIAFLFRGLAAFNHAGGVLEEVFAEADKA